MMPFNNYQQLFRILAMDSTHHSEYRGILQKYNMFVIILYDPNDIEQNDFVQYVNNPLNQRLIDRYSGDKLLFLLLCSPEEKLKSIIKKRDYYKLFDDMSGFGDLSIDTSLSINAICNALNVPYSKLPCLLVTNSLFSKKFQIYSTLRDIIEAQLSMLGNIAMSKYKSESIVYELIDEDMNRILQKYQNIKTRLIIENQYSLVHTLNYVFDFISAGSNPDDTAAIEGMKKSLIVISSNISRLKIDVNYKICNSNKKDTCIESSGEFRKLIKWYYYLATNLAAYYSANKNNVISNCIVDLDYLDKQSLIDYKTALTVYTLLPKDDKNNNDYSSAIICLSKMFEHEINLSIVQWIRNQLDIDLPQFYNCYQNSPKKTASYMIDGKKTDFNKPNWQDGRNSWIPPGMGETRNVLKEMIRKNELDFPKIEGLELNNIVNDKIYEQWTNLNRIRNKCAHAGTILNKSDYERVKGNVDFLIQNSWFQNLFKLKKYFSS